MADPVIGLLHPGEMGAALAMQLRRGRPVLWASSGRSAETVQRAEHAGLRDVGTVEVLGESSDFVLSVCPPHGALAVAESIAGFDGIYVDANSSDNLIRSNVSIVNAQVDASAFDYNDNSTGGGTGGTDNTYRNNVGRTQNRPGLIRFHS